MRMLLAILMVLAGSAGSVSRGAGLRLVCGGGPVPGCGAGTVRALSAVADRLAARGSGIELPAARETGPSAVAYRAPLAGGLRVVRGFDPPASRYGAGHLGVDLAAAAGRPVLAAGPGTVRFADVVAGRGVIVLLHPDGISTEYEPVAATVRVGTAVGKGTVIGRVAGWHRGCAPERCLHWGARRGVEYLDPLGLLRPLGVVRLLPWGWRSGSALPP